ncbi:MAG: ester cyclase [Deltaproteobacteria bacterium]|nr:ester cyclase [Deltaproteobacteria bacterium]
MSEANKAIVRRYVEELLNKGNLAAADEILTIDFVFHGPSAPESIRGREGFKQLVTTLRTAFPNLRFTMEEEIAEGDKVVGCFTIRGTQRGELFGIPPSGKQFVVRGVDIFRITGGKIREIRALFDTLGQMQQLGIVSLPGQAGRYERAQ